MVTGKESVGGCRSTLTTSGSGFVVEPEGTGASRGNNKKGTGSALSVVMCHRSRVSPSFRADVLFSRTIGKIRPIVRFGLPSPELSEDAEDMRSRD